MRCALGLASLENSSGLEEGEVSLPIFLFFNLVVDLGF